MIRLVGAVATSHVIKSEWIAFAFSLSRPKRGNEASEEAALVTFK